MKRRVLWHKKAPGHWYAAMAPGGDIVAEAVLTGSHLDDYPWDWYLMPDADSFRVEPASPQEAISRRQSGVADTLRSAKEQVLWSLLRQ